MIFDEVFFCWHSSNLGNNGVRKTGEEDLNAEEGIGFKEAQLGRNFYNNWDDHGCCWMVECALSKCPDHTPKLYLHSSTQENALNYLFWGKT